MDDDIIKQLKKLSSQARIEQEAVAARQKANQKQEVLSFQSAMAGVVPIKDNNRKPTESCKEPIRRRQSLLASGEKNDLFYISQHATDDEPPKQFTKFGQGKKDIQKLQSGKLRVVSTLDLHGYGQDEAQETLNEFIEYVQDKGVCAHVIHGSGLGSKGFSPILKNLVRRWLMAHPSVLAYCEPNNNDGAVLILIKRVYPNDPFAEEYSAES